MCRSPALHNAHLTTLLLLLLVVPSHNSTGSKGVEGGWCVLTFAAERGKEEGEGQGRGERMRVRMHQPRPRGRSRR